MMTYEVSAATNLGKMVCTFLDDWRINRILAKAQSAGISRNDLMKTHHRIAFVMRVQRAAEVCSSQEVIDYLADVMIGGFKSEEVDLNPDFSQMAVTALSSTTKTELNVILMMKKHDLFEGDGRADPFHARGAFVTDCCDDLNLNPEMLSAIQNGLIRTGLGSVDVSSRTALLHQNVPDKARNAGKGGSLLKFRNAVWCILKRNPKGWVSFYPLRR
ncbi:hypothetical protein ACU6TU_14715 [Halomonas sp. LS-001]